MTPLDPEDSSVVLVDTSAVVRYWIGVASHEHVRNAVEGGFCQLNHGKISGLKRIARGDRILYYSPREGMQAGKALKAFTAVGEVDDAEPYQVLQSETFKPFRRRVDYWKAENAEIGPLLDKLSFSSGKRNWGQVLRRGFFEIKQTDYNIIALAMGVARDE